MRELLYLKDDQLKEFIEKLFISYRESFSDAKKTLDKYSIGIAHHKVIHLLSIYKGITITDPGPPVFLVEGIISSPFSTASRTGFPNRGCRIAAACSISPSSPTIAPLP